jgi:hypothetical protein
MAVTLYAVILNVRTYYVTYIVVTLAPHSAQFGNFLCFRALKADGALASGGDVGSNWNQQRETIP